MKIRARRIACWNLWLVCGLLLSGCRAESDPAVAVSRGVTVKQSEFAQAYRDWLLRTGVQDTPQRRSAFVHDMAATRLAVMEARELGITGTPHFKMREQALGRKLLLDLYIKQVVLDTVRVSEADIRTLYTRAQTTVSARHLYARTLTEALELRQRLQGGESFAQLAQEIFRDLDLWESGGLLPSFTFDEMDPAFEEVAFTLPIGQISEPVRTAQGYSLIRVEERFIKPIITESEFQSRRPHYEAYALERARRIARRDYTMRLVDKSKIVFNDQVLEALIVRITPENEAFDQNLDSREILRYGDPVRVWTVSDFREHARFASDRQRAQVRTVADLRDFARGLVVAEQVLSTGQTIRDSQEYRTQLRKSMDRYIVEYLQSADSVDITDAELRAYYDNAPANEFMRPRQIALRWLFFTTEAEANAAKSSGTDFTGPEELFFAHQLGPRSNEIFDASKDAVVGPLETNDGWILLKTGSQYAESRQSFPEAKSVIYFALVEEKQREIRLAGYAELISRYGLKVDEGTLEKTSLLD
ncbi:MAG: peptidylprolyl isomerase [Bacteroidota bacterium]|nr:peptidylprolyl isomerase [Bacteroidota bacterium]